MPRQPDPVIGDPISAPWRKYTHREIDGLKRALGRLETDAEAGDKGLRGAINGLTRSISSLQQQQAYLESLARTEYAESTTQFAIPATGWYGGSRPSVVISSPTGRIEIGYGGSANNGNGFFCYSITQGGTTIVSRDSVRSNPARRVAVTGGASFAPSGWRTAVANVPADAPVTIQAEVYADGSYYVFGLAVQARVVP